MLHAHNQSLAAISDSKQPSSDIDRFQSEHSSELSLDEGTHVILRASSQVVGAGWVVASLVMPACTEAGQDERQGLVPEGYLEWVGDSDVDRDGTDGP